MKLSTLMLLLFFILSKNYAQEENYRELENRLFSNGYTYSVESFLHLPYEYKYYKEGEDDKKIEIVSYGKIQKDEIFYYFIFLSRTEVNNIVLAVICDKEGSERHYYKINTNNEPANTWVSADINMDGIIEEGEGHIAWW